MNNILIPIAFVREVSWIQDLVYVGAAYFEHRRSIKDALGCDIWTHAFNLWPRLDEY